MQIPAGLYSLFFLDKNTVLLFICAISIWHLLQSDGGTQAWIIRITGGMEEQDSQEDRKVNNSKLSSYPQSNRQTDLRALEMSEPPTFRMQSRRKIPWTISSEATLQTLVWRHNNKASAKNVPTDESKHRCIYEVFTIMLFLLTQKNTLLLLVKHIYSFNTLSCYLVSMLVSVSAMLCVYVHECVCVNCVYCISIPQGRY